MPLPPRLARRLRSARTWIGLGILAPVGMLAISGSMLLDLRHDAWDKAEQTSRNLLQVIERDIARNIEIFDLSLQGVVDNLRAPNIDAGGPALRQLVLFDRAATARDAGIMLVIDERGETVVDAGALPPRPGNFADRDYFKAHKERSDLGLFIGHPLVSRLTGEPMLPFSRRINKPDGSFGGVALGTLKLSYFSRLFDQLGLGPEGAINLYLKDGTRIIRHPGDEADLGVSSAGAPTFERFVREVRGSFVGTSERDGIQRHHTFGQVGDLPLVLDIALAANDIDAAWRRKAAGIGSIVLVLCGLTVFLSLLYGRDLRRRAALQAEFARLSRTDALTGVANRRRFEQVFERAWKGSRRAGKPLSLLIVDADHFKRFNDLHGHAVGDEVLKGLARSLSASVRKPGDLVARVGGEEFAVLLPNADEEAALAVARSVQAALATLAIPDAAIVPGTVTVSIGVAVAPGNAGTNPGELYRRADTALYDAKASGRNRIQAAKSVPLAQKRDRAAA